MDNINLNDYLSNLICNAYSANFMVLQQRKIAMPDTEQNIFTTDEIFKEKTFLENYEENVFDAMVQVRNELFESIDEQLEVLGVDVFYKNCLKNLIDFYNINSTKTLSYENLAPKSKNFDYETLHTITKELKKAQFKSDDDADLMIYLYNKFVSACDDYRTFVIDAELLQAIKNDIGQYGNKTLSFNKPDNANIIIMKKDFFENVFNDISLKLSNSYPKLFKKQSKKQKENLTDVDALNEMVADELYTCYGTLSYRFECANKPFLKNKEGLFGVIKKFIGSNQQKQQLFIDKIYVHRNELEDIISLIDYFPELKEEAQKFNKLIKENSSEEKTLNS